MNTLRSFSQSITLRTDAVADHLASSVRAVLPAARAFAAGRGRRHGITQMHLPPNYRMEDGSMLRLCWSIVTGRIPSLDIVHKHEGRETTLRFMDAEICDVDDEDDIRATTLRLVEGAAAVSAAYEARNDAPEDMLSMTMGICLIRDEEVRTRIPRHESGEGLPRMTILHDPSAMIEHPSPWTGGGFKRLVWMDPDVQMRMDRPYIDAAPGLVGVDAAMWAGGGGEMGFSIKMQPYRRAFRLDDVDIVQRIRLMGEGMVMLDRWIGGKKA